MKKLMIVAGEASGDLNGAALCKALKKLVPDVEFIGIGGKRMKEAGVEILFDITELAVVGFFEVLWNLLKFRNIFRQFYVRMLEEKPAALILIDYPGFNMRMADRAKKNGITVIYYISPQVWAWGKGRVRKLAKVVDKMLVIFPFEKDFYEDSGLDVEFVGHPVLDRMKPGVDRGKLLKRFSLSGANPVVAFLPGSRKQEVKRHLPVMLKAGAAMRKKMGDLQFVVPCASTVDSGEIRDIVGRYGVDAAVIEDQTCEAISVSDLVIASSGTATVESAYLLKPMVVMYKVSVLTVLLVKFMIKVENVAMVNIIAGEKVVPEFLQFEATPLAIAREAVSLLQNPVKRRDMVRKLEEVRDRLGSPGASIRAARAILKTVEKEGVKA